MKNIAGMGRQPTITMKMKPFFFDRGRVIRSVDRAKRRVLMRQGSLVRIIARRSMRRRRGPSRPGRTPNAHANPLLKERLFFAYDPGVDGVVVGPEKTQRPVGGVGVPQLMEEGGVVTRVKWRTGKRTRVKVPAHPFMGPALETASERYPDAWRGSVRRTN